MAQDKEMLSIWVSLEEFERSQIAIREHVPNTMTTWEKDNAKALCTKVADVIRDYYNRAIIISSGFRCLKVNRRLKSADSSQHVKGEAMDFTIATISIQKLFDDIRLGHIKGLVFDQLIFEGTWIHISYKKSGNNRGEVLKAIFKTGKPTEYVKVA